MTDQITRRPLSGDISVAATNSADAGPEELSFTKGDILTVVDYNDSGITIRNVDGVVGVVQPSSLANRPPIPLLPMPWFHFCGTRVEAENMLDLSNEGQFLVRPSQTSDSVYALSVCSGGAIKHYLIAINAPTSQITLDGKQFFDTLPHLIKYYKAGSEDVPPLVHPLVSNEPLKYYINKHSLQQYWGLSPEKIEIIKTVGHGEFGEVHAGTYRGLQVAIKTIPQSKEDGPAMQSFVQEASIMTHLRHRNLVQLVGVVFDGHALKQIVLEFMSKGSLAKYLASRGRSVVSQNELLNFARDICNGMVYIAEQGFVHRDLAARNVLLNSLGQAKISDFGLAKKADSHKHKEVGKFPVKWTAPEALKQSEFSEKSDVWSFGVCLWEIFSFGRVPYPSILAENVLEQLEEGYMMEPPDNCPDGIYDIMTSCWQYDPAIRPNFELVRVMLNKPLGESKTPCASPMLSRKAISDVTDKLEEMLDSEFASTIYSEAPATRSTSICLANVVVIGGKSAGKTSLLRSLRSDQFRQKELPTAVFDVPTNYCELVSHRAWLPSFKGLEYENELVHVIVEELVSKISSSSSPSNGGTPPLPRPHVRANSFHLAAPPPLPAPRQKNQRMSMLLERSPPPLPPIKPSGSHPEGFETTPPPESPKTKRSIVRRFSLNKLFRRSAHTGEHNRSASLTVTLPHPPVPDIMPTDSSPPLPARSSSVSVLPTFVSAIPDKVMSKLKEKIKDCSNGSLPLRVYGRLIDVSSQTGASFIKSLLLTKSTILLAVFDTSLGEGHDPIGELMRELHTLPVSSVASIVLVGTHSDKHSSAVVAKQKLDKVRSALKSSQYGSLLSGSSFIVSCSSLFDQSTIEDVKKYIVDLVKKRCQWKIPLRWLRCLRRFQNLSGGGQCVMSYSEAQGIINEVCMCKSKEETNEIIQFLQSHLIIISFEKVNCLRSTIITDPSWFFINCSKLLGMAEPSVASSIPSIFKPDYQMAISQGVVSEHLLEYLWPSTTRQSRQELLRLMHTLELISLKGLGSHPISPWESERSLTSSHHTTPSPSPTITSPTNTAITSVVIPSIVQEPLPEHLSSSSLLEPLFFFCSDPLLSLPLIFLRLVNRCIHSHPTNSIHYKDASCFLINPSTVLLVQANPDSIQITLHPSHHHSSTSPSSSLTTSSSILPSAETAMTVFMFIQAALTDVCQQWHPGLRFESRFACRCTSKPHYIVFDGTSPHGSLTKCQKGFKVGFPPLASPWFGEDPVVTENNEDEEYVNNDDIELIAKALQDSWLTLTDIGVAQTELDLLKSSSDDLEESSEYLLKDLCSSHLQSSSFMDLVENLEGMGRSDVADSLIDSRMKTTGITL